MKKSLLAGPWSRVVGIALIYRYCVIYFWAYTSNHNPITNWLLDTYAGSSDSLYYTFIYIHDTVVNIVIALPFAYFITKLTPDRRWLYAASIVLVMFIWEYRLVLFVHRDFVSFMGHHQAFFSLVVTLSALPTALLILTAAGQRRVAA